MESIEKEFWKSLAYQLLRYLMFTLGTFLTTYHIVDEGTATILSSRVIVEGSLGLILIAAASVWQYRKTWFNVIFPRAAHKSLPEIPLAVIKNDVLTNSKSGTSSV